MKKNKKTKKNKAANPLTIESQIQDLTEENQQDFVVPAAMAAEGLVEAVEADPRDEVLPQNLELVQVRSVIESILLAYDKPISLSILKEVFKGSGTPTDLIKRALSDLMVEYAGAERGMSIGEVSGGYQLRTKAENQIFVRRLTKGRPFKLSGPSLEVLSIIAYKQPIIKSEVDSIRGVESGHLVRALMDRSLVKFVGKSELPGKPMLYGTTRKFLEIFALRDLRELPSLSEIDELLPDGMMDEEAPQEGQKWGTIQDMSLNFQEDPAKHDEWEKITEEIAKIETTTNFFEEEKQRERDRRDQERAEGIREAMLNSQEISNKDKKWLQKYELSLTAPAVTTPAPTPNPIEAQTPEATTQNVNSHAQEPSVTKMSEPEEAKKLTSPGEPTKDIVSKALSSAQNAMSAFVEDDQGTDPKPPEAES